MVVKIISICSILDKAHFQVTNIGWFFTVRYLMIGTVELFHTSIKVFVQYTAIGKVHMGKRQVVVDIIDTLTSFCLLYQHARRFRKQFSETKRFLYLA